MTTPTNTIITQAATILQDAGLERWTQAELLTWGNEIQTDLVAKFPDANTKTSVVATVAGSRQLTPTDCIKLIDVPRNTNGKVIRPCDRKALDAYNPGWPNSKQNIEAIHWMPDPDPSVFHVFPPSVAGSQLDVEYGAKPAALVAGGYIGVRDEYASRLLNGILYRAYAKDAEFSGNQAAATAYYQLAFQ